MIIHISQRLSDRTTVKIPHRGFDILINVTEYTVGEKDKCFTRITVFKDTNDATKEFIEFCEIETPFIDGTSENLILIMQAIDMGFRLESKMPLPLKKPYQ